MTYIYITLGLTTIVRHWVMQTVFTDYKYSRGTNTDGGGDDGGVFLSGQIS